MPNRAEIENWNGPIGERWAIYQEGLDARIRVYGEQVLAAAGLREGMRVLDVGSGKRAQRTNTPLAEVCGIDLG